MLGGLGGAADSQQQVENTHENQKWLMWPDTDSGPRQSGKPKPTADQQLEFKISNKAPQQPPCADLGILKYLQNETAR